MQELGVERGIAVHLDGDGGHITAEADYSAAAMARVLDVLEGRGLEPVTRDEDPGECLAGNRIRIWLVRAAGAMVAASIVFASLARGPVGAVAEMARAM